MIITIKNLVKSYGDIPVLKGLDLTLPPQSQCVIQGASGSGKSTLLYLLGGLEKIEAGSIQVGDLELHRCGDEALAHYRNRHLGFVFQFHFLLSSMKVLDNIYLPAKIGPGLTAKIRERVAYTAERLGITHCLKKYPHQLSGGEQQRVNMVRACSLAPGVLLCDEPTGSLDSENTQKLVSFLKDISREFRFTLVLVTHDPLVASQFHKVLTINDGLITN